MDLLRTGPADARARLLLGHGAGASMDSRFMTEMAELLGARGIAVVRFEFSYMAARRTGGKRRPPPKAELLIEEYRAVVSRLEAGPPLLVGGKSMGGRVASLIAEALWNSRRAAGLVCLGYPFHPPAKPETLRTAHLATLEMPTLIVQGERDPFGTRTEVGALALSPAIRFTWLGDGDHDFGPRGASGFTRKGNLTAAADAVAAFAADVTRG